MPPRPVLERICTCVLKNTRPADAHFCSSCWSGVGALVVVNGLLLMFGTEYFEVTSSS